MSGDVRARMVAGAARLLARRGLQGTSFSEVLELTGAPRGSLYHHFPEGKDQLVAAAIDLAGDQLLAALDRPGGASAVQLTERFLATWRGVLDGSGLESGCAVLAVTVAADSPRLIDHAAAVFRAWRARLAELLLAAGLTAKDAAGFAATLIAAVEGAVVLSRAERSIEPFELVGEQLLAQARRFDA